MKIHCTTRRRLSHFGHRLLVLFLTDHSCTFLLRNTFKRVWKHFTNPILSVWYGCQQILITDYFVDFRSMPDGELVSPSFPAPSLALSFVCRFIFFLGRLVLPHFLRRIRKRGMDGDMLGLIQLHVIQNLDRILGSFDWGFTEKKWWS